MSDHHFQLPTSELDPIFQFAKDCFTRSYERFTGDVDEFNRNGNNDFFITEHKMGFVYLWKTGIINKMVKDLQHKLTIPVHDVIILHTPAHGSYQWHNEGMEYTEHATEQYRKVVRVPRRSVALNYPVSESDLSNSKIEWAEPKDRVGELLTEGYSNIMDSVGLNPPQAMVESHIKLRSATMPDTIIPGMTDILYTTHDCGEGVRIKSGHSIVYDNHDELLTKVDEYYGMPVPTLIRTNQWHRIDNTQVEEDRNMGSISFDPDYSYFDIKKLIMNNEFIK
jgi:hypothetical protein